MTAPDRRPHDPADTCTGHCHIHAVDEPGPGHTACFECGHLYRTRWHLRAAHLAVWWRITTADPLSERIAYLAAATWRPIHTCPHCTHDL